MVELLDVVEDEFLFMSTMIATNASTVNSLLRNFFAEARIGPSGRSGTDLAYVRSATATVPRRQPMMRHAIPLLFSGTALLAVLSACVMCP